MRRTLCLSFLFLAAACGNSPNSPFAPAAPIVDLKADSAHTDKRVPELGDDPSIVLKSQISMSAALAQSEAANGPTIEAKFELDDSKKLSLSIYPAKNGIDADAERNVFSELSGDPTAESFAGGLEQFHDQEHLTRSARDLTLVQLSHYTVADAVAWGEQYGTVYWAIPTIRYGRAGYGVYVLDDGRSYYGFLDGDGSDESGAEELADGPGAGATDARAPELGDDITIVRQSKISMLDALKMSEAKYGKSIEAKFELGDDGKLSLSIYPAGKGVRVDAERNTFSELSGDPTADTFEPSLSPFAVPDEEHLTRSARDLTLVQTAGLSLVDAVKRAQSRVPGGMVYWAIPTIRDTRAGYGVYVLGSDDHIHYFFVS
jgi:hypothetical protein